MAKRRQTEIPFLKSVIPKAEPAILDASLGCGATTLGLRLDGVKSVLSNERNEEMLNAARAEAMVWGLVLDTLSFDWRHTQPDLEGKFDAVLCLGNSLTCLFDESDRARVLRNFREMLAPGGVLVIDERNYPRILRGEFSQSGEYVYCGSRVICYPIEANDSEVVMEYRHLVTGLTTHLHLYPFKSGELRAALVSAGFDVVTYGDYRAEFGERQVEFFTHVAKVRET